MVSVMVPSFAFCQQAVDETAEPLVYENARAGLRLTAPAGWMIYQGMRRHPEVLAVFSRLPYAASDEDNPKIILIREKARKRGPASAVEKAFREAEVLRLMENSREIVYTELLESPAFLPGQGYSQLTYEVGQRGKGRVDKIRSREYVFFRDGSFYILICGSRPEFFEKYREDFESTVKSVSWSN